MPDVAIVGGGLIGRAWSLVFASANWNVRITDPDASALARIPERIRDSLEELNRIGLSDDVDSTIARIRIEPDLAAAVDGVSLVQESGPENLEVKSSIFRELDRLASRTAILASSSSAIVTSRYTEGLAGRARCLVAHPVNPPHLVPVVELCGAPWTDALVIDRAKEIYEGIGQVPVVLNCEIDGFVLNRLQGVLLAEAFRLVGDGVISPEDLDKTIKDGLGLRWSFLGPFETIELNSPGGMSEYIERYAGLYRNICASPAPPDVWDGPNCKRVLQAWGATRDSAWRSLRSAWRDSRLAALRVHKNLREEEERSASFASSRSRSDS